jgi:hypothetical protein
MWGRDLWATTKIHSMSVVAIPGFDRQLMMMMTVTVTVMIDWRHWTDSELLPERGRQETTEMPVSVIGFLQADSMN